MLCTQSWRILSWHTQDILRISPYPTNRRRSDLNRSVTWLPSKYGGYLIYPQWYLKSKNHYAAQPEKILIDADVPSIKNLRWVVQYLSLINTYMSIRVSKTHGSLRKYHWNPWFHNIRHVPVSAGLFTDQVNINLDQEQLKNDAITIQLNVSCDALATVS